MSLRPYLTQLLTLSLLPAFAALSATAGCASEENTPEATGGAPSESGGQVGTNTGGAIATGGSALGSGGASPSTGGSSTSGGTNSGGASESGGSGSGGSAPGTGGSADPATGGQTGSGGTSDGAYNEEFVEFTGEDCTVGEMSQVDTHLLPDPFLSSDGSRMSQKSDWSCQRATLKKAVETFIHGEKPGRPDTVTGTVSAQGIAVHVEHGGSSIDFNVSISLPSGATGPVPIVIGLGGVSSGAPGDANMSEVIKGEGVATGSYNNNQLSSETNKSGMFQTIYGSTPASAQIGWAWGFSRLIDVLVDERDAGRNDIIDPEAVAVTGCSRLGKGAFTIGAFDERIALGLPQESGTGGVSALRIVNDNLGGPNGQNSESIQSSFSAGPKWFGEDFINTYSNNVDSIPADMHSLVAMYAPRGLLVLDNSRIGELGSVAQHAASMAGGEVFKALGVEANIGYHGGNPSDPHNHCAFYQSQVEPLQRAIRGHLTHTAEPDGRMEPQPVATAVLSEHIDWTTPTLD